MPKTVKLSSPVAPAKDQRLQSGSDLTIKFLKAKVERVIMLLDASVLPEEVKTSWLTLLPKMSLPQVDRLTGLLEEELTVTLEYAKKHPEGEELLLKMQAAKDRYDAKIIVADQQAHATLDKIVEELQN